MACAGVRSVWRSASGRLVTADLRSPFGEQCPACDAEQPKTILRLCRQVVPPAPGHEIDVGQQVRSILARRQPTHEVAENVRRSAVIHRLKAVLGLRGAGTHLVHPDRNMSPGMHHIAVLTWVFSKAASPERIVWTYWASGPKIVGPLRPSSLRSPVTDGFGSTSSTARDAKSVSTFRVASARAAASPVAQ